jgi:hypothetical protein
MAWPAGSSFAAASTSIRPEIVGGARGPRATSQIAVWKALVARVVLLPRPVVADRPPVKVAGSDLVETRVDHHRYWTAAQSDLKRLLGPQKASANRDVDVEIGNFCAELAGLRSAARSQPHRASRIAAHNVLDVRGGLGVACEDEHAKRFARSRSAHCCHTTLVTCTRSWGQG